MEKKYLNEEKYQKARKKLIIAGLIIMVVGLLIGGSLIIKGLANKNNINNQYTEENKQKKIDDLNTEYSNLEIQIQPKLDEIENLEREKSRLSSLDDFDRIYEIEDEIAAINKEIKPIQDKMQKLESDIFFAENENIEFQKGFDSFEYIPLFIFGGFIIFLGMIIGGVVLSIAYRRNMLAYGAQTIVPVGKEVIDEMAPTVGNAVGEIAKGIKKGLDDEE